MFLLFFEKKSARIRVRLSKQFFWVFIFRRTRGICSASRAIVCLFCHFFSQILQLITLHRFQIFVQLVSLCQPSSCSLSICLSDIPPLVKKKKKKKEKRLIMRSLQEEKKEKRRRKTYQSISTSTPLHHRKQGVGHRTSKHNPRNQEHVGSQSRIFRYKGLGQALRRGRMSSLGDVQLPFPLHIPPMNHGRRNIRSHCFSLSPFVLLFPTWAGLPPRSCTTAPAAIAHAVPISP